MDYELSLVFTLCYLCLMLIVLFTILYKIIIRFYNKLTTKWIYGTCRGVQARKHNKLGNVQFILWKKGEQGHNEDFWYNFDSYWWNEFVENDKHD